MKKTIIISLTLLSLSLRGIAQHYFQQETNYTIQVSLNDKQHELSAFETIEYINHSPDTLRYIYFHLWPNGYSSNNTELAQQLFSFNGKEKLFNNPLLTGYIDSLNFKINNQPVKWNLLPNQPDVCQIWLNQSLLPGDTMQISTPFHVKIPEGVTSRMGHIGESYQITQWYPKPAVYDADGWHTMSYLNQGEFYSEFGSFDVSITLPSNYIVGATGNIQNKEEVEMLEKLAMDTSWYNSPLSENNDFPASSLQTKTLRYTESNIHDFAWFADKRFHVLSSQVKLPHSGKIVNTWVMFTNQQAGLWKNAPDYVNYAITNFSRNIGDYPYKSFTAVQSALSAGAGMEYPGIVVIGLVADAYALDEVITHEIGHNWFYSALGSNERRFPFMDEGLTSAYEIRYMRAKYPDKKLWEVYLNKKKIADFFHITELPIARMEEINWLNRARNNLEQPLNLPSTEYSETNYNLMIYYKAGLGFNYLRAYLGNNVFDSIMQAYYHKWKFKHPQPTALRKIVESHTNKDLTWFFDDYIGTTKQLDYKLCSLKGSQLLVKNNGTLASPLIICGTIGDSVVFEKWTDGFTGFKWITLPEGNYTEVIIDPKHITPEVIRSNNNIKTNRIFPKAGPLKFRYFFTVEDPGKQYIIYIPSANWTRENSFMLGLTIYNGMLVPKTIEYMVMPFVSFKTFDMVGFGKISYHFAPFGNVIQKATISLEGTKFGAPGNQDYYLAKTGFEVVFKPAQLKNQLQQSAYAYYFAASDLTQILQATHANINSVLQLGYKYKKTRTIDPYSLHTGFEWTNWTKKATLELNYTISYNGKNNGLDIRLFAGAMLTSAAEQSFYNLSASARGGREQYLYQGFFPDRFNKTPNSFWSKQMAISEGGLITAINDSVGYSPWLISLSFSSSLPRRFTRIPVKPFVNILLNHTGLNSPLNSPFFYETGIKAGIWSFIEIYIPLLVSPNIQSVNGTFKNNIRFVFNIESFNKIRLKSGRL